MVSNSWWPPLRILPAPSYRPHLPVEGSVLICLLDLNYPKQPVLQKLLDTARPPVGELRACGFTLQICLKPLGGSLWLREAALAFRCSGLALVRSSLDLSSPFLLSGSGEVAL